VEEKIMDKMSEVAKEIIRIDFKDSLKKNKNKFFDIMRKYGIKHGTKLKDGSVQVAAFEWTMAWSLFVSTMMREVDYRMFFDGAIPEDLKC
jgi:hypothetical protein